MATEIRIPVKLEVLQNSIADLQKILNNLQPNTSGYKAIEKIIQSMVQESQKLQAQLSKPFNSEGQFRTTNKTIEKLEESAARISVIMGQLKFSDLKLTPQQQGAFDELNNKINEIKSNYQTLSNEVKTGLLNKGNNADLIAGLPNGGMLEAGFAEIKNAVDKHVADLEAAAEKERAAYEKMRSNAELANRADVLTSSEGGISYKTVGKAIFDKFLYQNQHGIGFQKAFNNKAGTSEFLQALEQEFKLEPGALKDLIGKSFDQINAALQEYGKSGKSPFQGMISAYGSAGYAKKMFLSSQDLAELEQSVAKYKQLQEEINTLQQQKIDPADTATQQKLAGLNTELERLQDSILKTAGAGGSLQQPLSQINSQAQYLKNSLEQCNAQFLKMQRTTQSFNQMKMAVVNFMGFTQVLNLTKRAVKEAMNHIKELDSVMNKISIVTDMSTGDLWNQVDAYSKMAQTYGVSIKGAYEVSQIYYQQGLETADVLTLTNETLKLAKISGLDYATTTDYMTTALRGFKMEMSEASTVVDVYSNLAAHTAVSSEELAVAMSKTASSMESVGSTFEESSAMIATMVAVTRESATNIGSALKSIAARYGEMKKDPSALIDSEGEALAYNKVDAALQSVGITMKTTDGQFREFTDVILELSEKWNDLDSVQQRYIATQFAGNRQQSRFLALVSNKDLLKSNLSYAENAEDTGTLQALKALDSIESKTEQVRVAYQQFYTTIGAQDVWKGLLDGTKNVINTLNGLPKLFGKIPIGAIAAISSIVSVIKSLGIDILNTFAQTFGQGIMQGMMQSQGSAVAGAQSLIGIILSTIKGKKGEFTAAGQEGAQAYVEGYQQGGKSVTADQLTGDKKVYYDNFNKAGTILSSTETNPLVRAENVATYNVIISQLQDLGLISKQTADSMCKDTANYKTHLEELQGPIEQAKQKLLQMGESAEESGGKLKTFISNHKNLGQGLQSFGSALNMVAMMINTTSEGGKTFSGVLQGVAGAATLASVAVKVLNDGIKAMPWMALASGVLMVINAIATLIVTPEERIEELEKKAEELNNKAKETKANYRTLDNSVKKLNELNEKRYESIEATEEYQTAVDELAEKFPQLISGFDAAGNIIIDTTNAEDALASARRATTEATYKAIQAEIDAKDATRAQLQGKIRGKLQTISANNINPSDEEDYIAGSRVRQSKIRNLVEGQGWDYDYLFDDENSFDASLEEVLDTFWHFGPDRIQELIGDNYWDSSKNRINTDAIKQALINNEIKFDENNQDDQKIKEALNEVFNISSTIEEEMTAIEQEATFLAGSDLTSPENINRIGKLNERIRKFEASNPGMLNPDITKQDGVLDQLLSLVSEYTGTTDQLTSLSQQEISLWQQVQATRTNAWNYMFNSTGLTQIATKYLETLSNGQKWSTFIAEPENLEKVKVIEDKLQQFYERLSLDPEKLKLFEQMISDTNNYSGQDIINEFAITDTDIINAINNRYVSSITNLRDSLKANLAATLKIEDVETLELNKDNLSDFYKQYYDAIEKATTPIQRQYLTDVLSSYQNLDQAGYKYRASAMGQATLDIFDQILTIENPLIAKQMWQLINENGLTTLEGIQKIKDAISNNSELKNEINIDSFLDILSNSIIPNINLSLQTATSNLLDTWEDTSKELTKAMSGGLTLKEADALINQAKALGMEEPININDFVLAGDKLILGYDDFKRYYESLQASANSSADQLKTRLEAVQEQVDISALRGGYRNSDTKWVEGQRALLESIGFEWTNEAYWKDGHLTDDGVQAYYDAIKKTTDEWNSFNTAAKIAANQLMNSYERSQGIYKLNATDETALTLDELTNIAKGLDLKGEKLGKNAISERAIKDQINPVYDTLISDVLSKGFDNINLADYEGLISGQTIDLSDNYEEFVKKYVDFTGKTVDEINDLILQARTKDRETTSEDLIKDVTFVSENIAHMSEDTLGNIANAFDKSITELLDSTAVVFDDTLGEYVVNVAALKDEGINLTSIDNFKLIVQESIDALFNSITSDISSALGGSLSVKNQKNLVDNLGKLGIDMDLQFTRTAKGLKLSETSAISLYNELKKIDALQSQLVFDELSKSLQETNEHYKGISGILNRIAWIEDKDHPARAEQYAKELELAKEILAVRSTTEDDSFNFMSNKIPAAQNNPINYYNNWSKAIKTVNDALKNQGSYTRDGKTVKSGFIDYQDWYNIATEMNNIARISGKEIEFAGVTLDGSLETASKLIQKGASSLVATDGGDIKVALQGMSLNFEQGADAFSGNVSDGIKEVAKSQIDMLDSMIQLLETIVAMEQLGDIEGEDNVIDFSDLFDVKWDTEKDDWEKPVTEFSEGYDKFRNYVLEHIDEKKAEYNKDLADGISKTTIKVGDNDPFNLGDMLNMDPAKLAEHAKDGLGDAYAAVLQAYKQAALSGNYDIDNIMASIKEVLGSTNFEGEISIGDLHLIGAYNTILEKGKDGKIHVGDKIFTSVEEAAAYQNISELNELKGASIEAGEKAGEFTVENSVVTNAIYNINEGTYDLTFSDGTTTSVKSKAAANLAIATWMKMHPEDAKAAETAQNTGEVNGTTFTFYQNGIANLEFTIKDGKVEVKGNDETLKEKAQAAAQAALEDQAGINGKKVTGTIDDLDLELSANANAEINLDGKELTVSGTPTATITTIKFLKDSNFSITGDEEIWNELTTTKEGYEFIAYVLHLITSKDANFTNDEGASIWSEVVSSKTGQTFIEYVLKLMTAEDTGFTNDNGESIWAQVVNSEDGKIFYEYVKQLITKEGEGFTNDEGQSIWSLVDPTSDPVEFIAQVLSLTTQEGEGFTNDEGVNIWEKITASKEYPEFVATVAQLITNPASTGFTNDEGKSIWDLVVASKDYPAFAAQIAQLITQQGEGFTNDEGQSIWKLVKDSKDYETFYAKVKSLAAAWAQGANKVLDEKDLHIPSKYTSPTPITVTKYVNVEYENVSNENPYEEMRRTLYNANIASRTYTLDSNVESTLGISHDFFKNYSTNNNNLKEYLTSLQQIVKSGETLGNIDLKNVRTLSQLKWSDTSISSLLTEIGETNNWNLANLNDAVTQIQALSGIDATGLDSIAASLDRIAAAALTLINTPWSTIAEGINSIGAPVQTTEQSNNAQEETGSTTVIMTYEADTTPATEAAEAAKKDIESESATEKIEGEDNATEVGKQAQNNINAMTAAIQITASNSATDVINSIKTALDNLKNGGPYNVTVHANVATSGGNDVTGNVGVAHAAGTLMGELGPELVVSNGRYFVAGQNGPEMVDLSKDAIVFNHLQTKSLLDKGMSTGRGKAVTNERNAISFAKGNIHGGPAMASAGAALAALKQLRAQWQSLLGLSTKDLASKGGGGGGGGGKNAAFIKELERWYNYLQRIAQLEKEINYEEAKRNRIKSQFDKSGKAYYQSQKESLKDLQEESNLYKSLAKEQQAYFNQRLKEVNAKSNPFTSLYKINDKGQLEYKNGALQKLSAISGRDNSGKPYKTVKQQYDAIVKMNPKFANFMKYDQSGNAIEYDKKGKPKDESAYQAAVQAFWDKMDADKEEFQSLHDSIEDAKKTVEELDTKRNELLQEMRDNQITVEERVVKAIEDRAQREIDNLNDQRSALEDSTSKYIDGLSKALTKERDMYQNNQEQDELNKLMRQLDILKRSGGSASQIRDLQNQIDAKQQDAYFDIQQEQIDAIQEAADEEIARLDTQIDLLTKQLEFQKEMGLLWEEVYDVMSHSATYITDFIMKNDSEWWNKSPVSGQKEFQQAFFEADQWVAYRDDIKNLIPEGKGMDDKSAGDKNKKSNKDSTKDGKKDSTKDDKDGKKDDKGKKSDKDKDKNKNKKVTGTGQYKYKYLNNTYHQTWEKMSDGTWKDRGQIKHTIVNGKCSRCKRTITTRSLKPFINNEDDLASMPSLALGTGGLITEPTNAIIGETSKPEAVLNPEQTKILRENILSNKPTSLVSLLSTFNDVYSSINNIPVGTSTASGVIIENATVEMHVDQIANDYDAQRAGEKALEKMLQIARKTSAANSVRR